MKQVKEGFNDIADYGMMGSSESVLRSSSSHPVGFSELPIQMDARCPFLESVLNQFYESLDESDSTISRQKTLGGCKLVRQGMPDHYILAFSGNNEMTFDLHGKLQAFLEERKVRAVAQARCVSPVQKPVKRAVWHFINQHGHEVTIELAPKIILSSTAFLVVHDNLLPLVEEREPKLLKTIGSRSLTGWACSELKAFLFAHANEDALGISNVQRIQFLAYHYNNGLKIKPACGCCQQLPNLKMGLGQLGVRGLSRACEQTPSRKRKQVAIQPTPRTDRVSERVHEIKKQMKAEDKAENELQRTVKCVMEGLIRQVEDNIAGPKDSAVMQRERKKRKEQKRRAKRLRVKHSRQPNAFKINKKGSAKASKIQNGVRPHSIFNSTAFSQKKKAIDTGILSSSGASELMLMPPPTHQKPSRSEFNAIMKEWA